jgi:WD40 repeat protein
MPVVSLGRIEDAHQLGVWALAGLANRRFVSGGLDGALRLWQLPLKASTAGLDALDAPVDDSDTTRDEQDANKPAHMLNAWPDAHHLAVTSLSSAPKRNLVVSAGFDGRVCLWALDTEQETRSPAAEIQLNPLETFQIVIAKDATKLAVGGDAFAGAARPGVACVASLFAVPSAERLQSFEIEPASQLENYRFTTCLCFVDHDETGTARNWLLCGGNDGSLISVDVETRAWNRCPLYGTPTGEMSASSNTVMSGLPIRDLAQASQEPEVVFCASEDECVHVVDWRMSEQASLFGTAGSGPLFAVTIAEDDAMLVFAAGADGRVRAYDRRTGECVYTRGGDATKAIWALRSIEGLGMGNHHILCGGDDGFIEVLKT